MEAEELSDLLEWLAMFAVPYLAPTVVGALRRHRQLSPIALLNVLLGWTVVGWVAALVWALTPTARPLAADAEGARGFQQPRRILRDAATGQWLCPRCSGEIEPDAVLCPRCGIPTQPATPP